MILPSLPGNNDRNLNCAARVGFLRRPGRRMPDGLFIELIERFHKINALDRTVARRK